MVSDWREHVHLSSMTNLLPQDTVHWQIGWYHGERSIRNQKNSWNSIRLQLERFFFVDLRADGGFDFSNGSGRYWPWWMIRATRLRRDFESAFASRSKDHTNYFGAKIRERWNDVSRWTNFETNVHSSPLKKTIEWYSHIDENNSGETWHVRTSLVRFIALVNTEEHHWRVWTRREWRLNARLSRMFWKKRSKSTSVNCQSRIIWSHNCIDRIPVSVTGDLW